MLFVYKTEDLIKSAATSKDTVVFCPEEIFHFDMPSNPKMSAKELKSSAEARAKKVSASPESVREVAVLRVSRKRALVASYEKAVPKSKADILPISMLAAAHWLQYAAGQHALYTFYLADDVAVVIGIQDDGTIPLYRLMHADSDLLLAELKNTRENFKRSCRNQPFVSFSNSERVPGDELDYSDLDIPASAYFYKKKKIFYKLPATVLAVALVIFSLFQVYAPAKKVWRLYKPYSSVKAEVSKLRSTLNDLKQNVKYLERIKNLDPAKVTMLTKVFNVLSRYNISVSDLDFEPDKPGKVAVSLWSISKSLVDEDARKLREDLRRFRQLNAYLKSPAPEKIDDWYKLDLIIDFGDISNEKKHTKKNAQSLGAVRRQKFAKLDSSLVYSSSSSRKLYTVSFFLSREETARNAHRNFKTSNSEKKHFERIKQTSESWFDSFTLGPRMAQAAEEPAFTIPKDRLKAQLKSRETRKVSVSRSGVRNSFDVKKHQSNTAKNSPVSLQNRKKASRDRASVSETRSGDKKIESKILYPRRAENKEVKQVILPQINTSPNTSTSIKKKAGKVYITTKPLSPVVEPKIKKGLTEKEKEIQRNKKNFVITSGQNKVISEPTAEDIEKQKELEKKKKEEEAKRAEEERRRIIRLLDQLVRRSGGDLSKTPLEDQQRAFEMLKRELERTQKLLIKKREAMRKEPKVTIENPDSLYLKSAKKGKVAVITSSIGDFSAKISLNAQFKYRDKLFKMTAIDSDKAIAISTDYEIKLIFLRQIVPPRIYNPGGLRIVRQENGVSYILSDPISQYRDTDREHPQLGRDLRSPSERLTDALSAVPLINITKTLELKEGSRLLFKLFGTEDQEPLLFICKKPERGKHVCEAEGGEQIIFLMKASLTNKVVNPVETYFYGFEKDKIFLTHSKVRVGIKPGQVFTLKDIIMPEYVELSKQSTLSGSFEVRPNSANEDDSVVSFSTTSRMADLEAALKDPFFYLPLRCEKPTSDTEVRCFSEFGDLVIFSKSATKTIINPQGYRILFFYSNDAYVYNGETMLRITKGQEISALDLGLEDNPFSYVCNEMTRERLVCKDRAENELIFLKSPLKNLHVNPEGYSLISIKNSEVVLANDKEFIRFRLSDKLDPSLFNLEMTMKLPLTCSRKQEAPLLCSAEDGTLVVFLKKVSYQTLVNPDDYSLIYLSNKYAVVSNNTNYYKIEKNQYIDGKTFGIEDNLRPLKCAFYSNYVECKNELNKRIMFLKITQYKPYVNPDGFYLRTTYPNFAVVSNGEEFYKIYKDQYIDARTFGIEEDLLPFKCSLQKTQVECKTETNQRILFLKATTYDSKINPDGYSLLSIVNDVAIVSNGSNFYRLYDGQYIDGKTFGIEEDLLPFKCEIEKKGVICKTDENKQIVFLYAGQLIDEDTNLDSTRAANARNVSNSNNRTNRNSTLNSNKREITTTRRNTTYNRNDQNNDSEITFGYQDNSTSENSTSFSFGSGNSTSVSR